MIEKLVPAALQKNLLKNFPEIYKKICVISQISIKLSTRVLNYVLKYKLWLDRF